MRRHYQNIERIIAVARQLEDLLQNVVFAGGAVTELLITDPVFPAVLSALPSISMLSLKSLASSTITGSSNASAK